MKRVVRRLLGRLRAEDGNSSIEFALALPFVLYSFFAVFEGGMFMTRYVMIDSAVDQMVRDLRLGKLTDTTFKGLKERVCARTIVVPNCMTELKLELMPVNSSTWTFPTSKVQCVNRSQPIDPLTDAEQAQIGSSNQTMLIRACVTMDAMFPTTGIGLRLKKSGDDGYDIITTSAFTNEPKG